MRAGFHCFDAQHAPLPESECEFGPIFNGTFDGGQIQNEKAFTPYGDKTIVSGTLGYEDVTIAGISVKHQEVALIDKAHWHGDGVTSGLVGLGYAASISATMHSNANKTYHNITRLHYSPIFQTMYTQGLCAPMFSLALERDRGGYIAFGELPPVQFDPVFAKTPIRIVGRLSLVVFAATAYSKSRLSRFSKDSENSQISGYFVVPDGFVYVGSSNSQVAASAFPVLIDSGTTALFLPDNMAVAVNALFDPPARFVENEGWYVECNGKAPAFGVTISGQTFNINPLALVLQGLVDSFTGLCLSGIQSGDDLGGYILGEVFLKNVVVVFDVGAAEMRFAAHEY